MWTGGFPEPLTFSLRARRHLAARRGRLRRRARQPDARLRPVGPRPAAGHHHPPPDHRGPPARTGRRRRTGAAGCRYAAGTASRACRSGWPGGCRPCSPSPVRRATRSSPTSGCAPGRIHTVPIGADTRLFSPDPSVPEVPGRIVTTSSADVPLKGLVFLVEALAKVRVQRPDAHLVVVGKRPEKGPVAHAMEDFGLAGRGHFVKGISDAELVDLIRSAEVACVPVAVRGLLAARRRGHGHRHAAGRHHRRRDPRGGRARRRDLPGRAAGRRGRPGRRPRPGCWTTPRCAAASAPPAAPACWPDFTWTRAAEATAELYRAAIAAQQARTAPRRRRPGRRPRPGGAGPRPSGGARRGRATAGRRRRRQDRPNREPPWGAIADADRRLHPFPAGRGRPRPGPRLRRPGGTRSSATGAARTSSRWTATARRSARSPSGSRR